MSWRSAARVFLASQVPPQEVAWLAPGEESLFDAPPAEACAPAEALRIPRTLAELLEACACHRDPARWPLMYRLLWRVVRGGEARLLEDEADADVLRLRKMARAVEQEAHRMHAFVRFRESRDADGTRMYVAWFEPEHDVLRRAAPFFRDRFASMQWVIATPTGAASWNGKELAFVEATLAKPPERGDDAEALWRTYYASVFNPARLNPRGLRQHMPRRLWKNLPEAQEIAPLSRRAAVLAPAVDPPRWASRVRVAASAPSSLEQCRRCALWENATRAVAGQGPTPARLMIVGEQPGDEEDLAGLPFVGPAGKVLDRALVAAALDRSSLYLTNAVKHFKWEPRGKRRMHKTPAQREIEACVAWLEREIEQVRPEVIVALGGSAAFALANEKTPIRALRGQDLVHASGARLVVTYHPSAVLRAKEDAEGLYAALCEDLSRVARWLAPGI